MATPLLKKKKQKHNKTQWLPIALQINQTSCHGLRASVMWLLHLFLFPSQHSSPISIFVVPRMHQPFPTSAPLALLFPAAAVPLLLALSVGGSLSPFRSQMSPRPLLHSAAAHHPVYFLGSTHHSL